MHSKLPISVFVLIMVIAITGADLLIRDPPEPNKHSSDRSLNTLIRNLKCYVCEPCIDGGILNKTATGCDWCEKKTIDGVVYRRCVQGECPTKLPDGLQSKYTYYCCQTDYCNEGARIGSWKTLWSLLIAFVIPLVRLY